MYKDVWNRNININQSNLYPDIVSAIHRIQQEKFVFISEPTILTMYLAERGICDVTFSKDNFFPSYFGFPVSKDFPYTELFNKK